MLRPSYRASKQGKSAVGVFRKVVSGADCAQEMIMNYVGEKVLGLPRSY